jgi:hypothetical protein
VLVLKELYKRSTGWHNCSESVFRFNAYVRTFWNSLVLCLITLFISPSL